MEDDKPDYSNWKRWCFIRRGNTDCGPIKYTVDVDGFIHIGNNDCTPIIYTLTED